MSLSVNAQVTALVDKIATLTEQIASGKKTYAEQTAKADAYKKRRKQLKKIRSNVKSRFDDNVSTIKKRQSSLHDKLADATSGLSYESTLVASISNDKEQAVESDTYMSSVLENIEAEINACESKMESAAEQASATKARVNEDVDIVKGYIAQLKKLMQDSECSVSIAVLSAPLKIR